MNSSDLEDSLLAEKIPKIFLWISNAMVFLVMLTAVLFLLAAVFFLTHNHIYLAIFYTVLSYIFVIISMEIRKINLLCFKD